MPDEAASEMMATRFSPERKACFSAMLTWSCDTPLAARCWISVLPSVVTMRILRPVISATISTPKWEMRRSRALPGILIFSSFSRRSSLIFFASGTTLPSRFSIGRCFSSIIRAISCGVETSESSSRPFFDSRSAASFAFASPVERRPMTTDSPRHSAW